MPLDLALINIGSTPNDGTGDPARTWATKTNDNMVSIQTLVNALESLKAPLANPNFTGAMGDAPPFGNSSNRLATTAWTQAELASLVSAINAALSGKVNDSGDQITGPLILKDAVGEGSVVLTPAGDANPGKVEMLTGDGTRRLLLGFEATAETIKFMIEAGWTLEIGGAGNVVLGPDVRATTQSPADNSTKLATTAYVDTAAAGSGVAVGTRIMYDGLDSPPNTLPCDGASYSSATYAALFAKLVKSATVTISIATPGVISWASHGLKVGYPVKFTTTGALPTGLTVGTTYWVISAGFTANSFRVAATPNGTAINTSGSQSGVHTGICAPHGCANNLSTFNVPDTRAVFVRGFDDGRGIDLDRGFGQEQLDAFQGHVHPYAFPNGAGGSYTLDGSGGAGNAAQNTSTPANDGTNGVPRTAAETRPRNNTTRFFIKYQ